LTGPEYVCFPHWITDGALSMRVRVWQTGLLHVFLVSPSRVGKWGRLETQCLCMFASLFLCFDINLYFYVYTCRWCYMQFQLKFSMHFQLKYTIVPLIAPQFAGVVRVCVWTPFKYFACWGVPSPDSSWSVPRLLYLGENELTDVAVGAFVNLQALQ